MLEEGKYTWWVCFIQQLCNLQSAELCLVRIQTGWCALKTQGMGFKVGFSHLFVAFVVQVLQKG